MELTEDHNPAGEGVNSKTWNVLAVIDKYEDEAAFERGEIFETVTVPNNLLLNAGITRLLNRLNANATTPLAVGTARIGVGISNTAAVASQTDLQGASKFFKLCSSVTVSAQSIIAVSAFGASDGNFAWEEWGLDFGTVDGTTVVAPLLNRRVTSMGTKANPAVWTFTVTITVS